MKRIFVKAISLIVLMLIVLSTFVGCPKEDTSGTVIKFWYCGTDSEKALYQAMTDKFNETRGKELGITVTAIPKPASDYVSAIEKSGLTKTGPDVFMVSDRYYKAWATLGFLTNMEEYLSKGGFDTSSMWSKTLDVLRYDVENKTSGSDDPLWGIPVDTSPSAIFYNEDAFKQVGIIVISVDAEDLDEWNKGNVKDNAGKTKEDYGITIDVPAKGFYRSEAPFVNGVSSSWVKPTSNEILIFNNRIAMNWDELEDLAALTTKEGYNSESSTLYGYYSTYWFNYGWSVGGDCIEDLSANGEGDWTFTLGDQLPNYIVQKPGFVGSYTGKTYSVGEAVDLKDKLNADPEDKITADNKGGYLVNGEPASINSSIKSAVADGVLAETPSTKEAFSRWANLRLSKADGGLAVCPFTTKFATPATDQGINYFIAGKVAMILEHSYSVSEVQNNASFNWNVAPLPVYKTYTDAQDPSCDTVDVQGIEAGHFGVYSLAIREKSTNKDAAYEFIKWMCGEEGQEMRAAQGYVPNYESLATNSADFYSQAQNMQAFLDGMDYLTTGDWSYLSDRAWIDNWANDVNGKIQQGKMTIEQYFNTDVIASTNNILIKYK